MDFMNLNQAAHGDREFGYLETRMRVRRKTVVGHVSDPSVRARVGSWVRAAVGVRAARDLRLARFGDNMRDVAVTEGDKTEAQIVFGMSVNTYGVNDLVAVVDPVPDSDVDALVAEYDELYDVVDELARRRPARVTALRGADRARAAAVPRGRTASTRSRATSRTWAAFASCPAWPSSG